MSKIVEEVTLGIDVSKRSLDVFAGQSETHLTLENSLPAIQQFLDSLTGPVVIAIEATNTFHEALIDHAVQRGHTLYLVDGYRLSKYRDAVGMRAKTDKTDAQLLYRYLLSERTRLRPVTQSNPLQRLVWRLIKRRAKLVNIRTQLRLSMSDLTDQGVNADEAVQSLTRLINCLTARARMIAKQLGWSDAMARLRSIPGVGELNALALMVMYRRGTFANVDRFIAFLGLDVRVRESGTFRGRRKLTKKGDPEVRRLLFNGARQAAYHRPYWHEMKEKLKARGLSEIQVSVIQARKIARIAFALLNCGGVYDVDKITCNAS